MINSFNVNDLEGGDEISMTVYSDVIDDMFKCGQFNFKSGDAVDFHDFIIPCRNLITVTLTEKDGTSSDGHTIFIPCNSNSDMTIDFVIPRGSVTTVVDKLQNVNQVFNFLNFFNPWRETAIGVQLSSTVSELSVFTQIDTSGLENEALYNMKLEIVEDVDDIYFPDERILNNRCGATQVTFKKGSSY